jgi:hypothetical protein
MNVPWTDELFFQPSIDVEVALRDGALDVGIFGPEHLMNEGQAGEMLKNLHDELVGMI